MHDVYATTAAAIKPSSQTQCSRAYSRGKTLGSELSGVSVTKRKSHTAAPLPGCLVIRSIVNSRVRTKQQQLQKYKQPSGTAIDAH